jgi:hypothetical protein
MAASGAVVTKTVDASFQVIIDPEIGRPIERLAGLVQGLDALDGEHPDVFAEVTVADGVPAIVDQGQVEWSPRLLVSSRRPLPQIEPVPADDRRREDESVVRSYCDSIAIQSPAARTESRPPRQAALTPRRAASRPDS